MDGLHAAFSVGVLVGAASAGLLRKAGAHPSWILIGIGTLTILTAAVNVGSRPAPVAATSPQRTRLRKGLLTVGVVLAFAFVVESGIENWSALFLQTEHDASPAATGLGPGMFATAMVLGRTAGQGLEALLGARGLLAFGAVVAASGLVLAATSPSIPIAVAGFFLGGAGISVGAPALFGAAGRGALEAERGSALASVTTVSYLGFLAGPPFLGAVAGAADLRVGMAALAGLAALLALATASPAGGALALRAEGR
jgi:sugar phosphate permease